VLVTIFEESFCWINEVLHITAHNAHITELDLKFAIIIMPAP